MRCLIYFQNSRPGQPMEDEKPSGSDGARGSQLDGGDADPYSLQTGDVDQAVVVNPKNTADVTVEPHSVRSNEVMNQAPESVPSQNEAAIASIATIWPLISYVR